MVRVRLQFFILGLLAGWWLSRQDIDWQGLVRLIGEWGTLPEPRPMPPKPVVPAAASRPIAAAAEKRAEKPAPEPPSLDEPDVLTEIKGIGPTFEHALRQVGITTFAQLAVLDADALADKLDGRVSSERIRRENWIAQAQERARAGK